VHEVQVAERTDVTYATVLRLMQVMHGKGLLTRDDSERSHVYAPAVAQRALQSSLLKDVIHKAFSGSGKDLVLAALRGHVTAEERAEIQRFLKESRHD
jgi:predicted transcriptional regulator